MRRRPSRRPRPRRRRTSRAIAELEARLAPGRECDRSEREGSAGRADALVVAFAARRAIDRGVALGYLETLLVDRFGAQHQQAVATIITASRQPVRLNDLIAEYDDARARASPRRRRRKAGGAASRRELGSLVEVHRADRPAINPDARYQRAQQRLSAGEVDQALAETMRLPGAPRAADWVAKARRYILAHRALDEIESARASRRSRHRPLSAFKTVLASDSGMRFFAPQRTAAVKPACAK